MSDIFDDSVFRWCEKAVGCRNTATVNGPITPQASENGRAAID
jgi:hypothetical protein